MYLCNPVREMSGRESEREARKGARKIIDKTVETERNEVPKQGIRERQFMVSGRLGGRKRQEKMKMSGS